MLLAIVLGQLLIVNLALMIRGGPSDNLANYRGQTS